MNTREQKFDCKKKLLVIALLAAFGSVQADDSDVAKLSNPDSTVMSVGAAGIASSGGNERTFFGEYSGWSGKDGGLLLDFEMIKRNDATGIWTRAEGRNLGQDNRELSYSREKQGDWKYALDYSELVRRDTRPVNSGLQGAGTSQLTVNALTTTGTGTEQNFDIKRKSAGFDAKKWLVPNHLLVEASIKSENKDGIKRSGIGAFCSNIISGYSCGTTMGALLMLPEPIVYETHQLEAKVSLIETDYSITAGYYVSYFRNDNGSMKVNSINGNLNNGSLSPTGSGANTLGNLLTQNIALAPDNQAYQFYLSGNYSINPTTRGTFSYAHTHATQTESFARMGLTVGAGLPGNPGAVVDTTLTQFGLTARPLPKLSMLGNVRFEQIQDETPHAKYDGVYSNATNSSKKLNGKAEATYQLPESIRATLGVDYIGVNRDIPAVGSTELTIAPNSLTSVRESTNEIVYRAELRKPISETMNASIAYLTSEREGSHWINLGSPTALYPQTYQIMRNVDIVSASGGLGTFPSYMMDRSREKIRMMVDWTPINNLSLQFMLENGRDRYSAPTAKGLHSTEMTSASVDAAYTLSQDWKATGYVNYGDQTMYLEQGAGYIANLDNKTVSVGVGLLGKLTGKIDVGSELTYLNDRSIYGLGSGNSQAASVLPDVAYQMYVLKLFGKYALDKSADVRVDLVHQRQDLNEWTWANAGVPFAYSDNSTVLTKPNQQVTYLGVRYVYRFK